MRTLAILLLVVVVAAATLGLGCLLEGDPGSRGSTGATGPVGPAGEQGDPGPQGDMPAHEWSDTELRFQNPDGSWGDYTDIPQGAAGPQGEQGPQGLQGDVGPAGPQGSQGIQGETGPAGETDPPDDPVDYPYAAFLVYSTSSQYKYVTVEAGDRITGSFTSTNGDVHFWLRDPFGFYILETDGDVTSQEFAVVAAVDGTYALRFYNDHWWDESLVNLDVTVYPSIQVWVD